MQLNIQYLIRQAKLDAPKMGQKPIERLEQLAGLDCLAFVEALASAYAYETLALHEMLALTPDFKQISFSEALQRNCVLLEKILPEGDVIKLFVFSDIYDQEINAWATEMIDGAFTSYLAHSTDIAAFLAKHEDGARAMHHTMTSLMQSGKVDRNLEELSLNTIDGDTSTVVKLVRSTLYDALKVQASDIHLETIANGLVIKYRLDGVLSQIGEINEKALADQVVSRIKVIAELDITEQRIPQDGRFRALYQSRDVDFRVSVMPSIHGEDVVIRVLDKQTLVDEDNSLRLDVLGFDAETMAVMREQFSMPYGMVLVTGPTGSGKTTTLYAAISETNHGNDKIITIEDPVEYELKGVLQIPVNEKKGLTFARGLRSILRHDPDRIMVGEIRDTETAQIAVQSALTGHLVFTTVHANHVFDVIGRFLNMGVDAYSFVSALNVVVAQRLLRLNCPHCSQTLTAAHHYGFDVPDNAQLKKGLGCGACRGTGYKGRQAIAEVLLMNDELRELIANRASIRKIKLVAVENGTKFLHQVALKLAIAGKTTLEEVKRVAPNI